MAIRIRSDGHNYEGYSVGVSSYALGGGWGYSARKFGLDCDSLVEVELVNYKGCALTASKYKNTQVKVLDTWQKWISSVDNNINLSGGLYNTKEEGLYAYFRGISYKNLEDTQKLLEPFYNIEGAEINLEYDVYVSVVNEEKPRKINILRGF